jgi:uncharacterized membrane protein
MSLKYIVATIVLVIFSLISLIWQLNSTQELASLKLPFITVNLIILAVSTLCLAFLVLSYYSSKIAKLDKKNS